MNEHEFLCEIDGFAEALLCDAATPEAAAIESCEAFFQEGRPIVPVTVNVDGEPYTVTPSNNVIEGETGNESWQWIYGVMQ